MQIEIFDGSNAPDKGEIGPITTDQMRKIWALRTTSPRDGTAGMRIVAVAGALSHYRGNSGKKKKLEVIAGELGTTGGQIHHYISIIQDLAPELQAELSANRLTFKEARSLADLETWGHQRTVAQLFVDDWLSSMHVEAAIRVARAYPDLGARAVLAQVVRTEPIDDVRLRSMPFIPSESIPILEPSAPAPEPEPEPEPRKRPAGADLTPTQLQEELAYAAGVIRCATARKITYVDGLGVLVSLRQLQGAAGELEAVLS